MIAALFNEILRSLPRVAEEGIDSESIAETALVERVTAAAGGPSQAATAVAIIGRQLSSLALLDDQLLSVGRWQFVSFPALLCARGLLNGFADDQFAVVEKGFWEASEFRVDRQRALLRHIESARQAASQAAPIRRVWVAWALMASDDKFLMVRREDSQREREGSRGTFVLPGGRLSAADLGNLSLTARLDLFDPSLTPDTSAAESFLRKALVRELEEELELGAGLMDTVAALDTPIRYTALEGAGSAHGLTEYIIQAFDVSLTEPGKDKLLRTLSRFPDRYSWFSLEELKQKQNSSNHTAFVDALWPSGSDHSRILDATQRDLGLSPVEPIGDAIDLPATPEEPFLMGPSGRERACLLPISSVDLYDIAFLAAVRRGDPITNLAEGIRIVPDRGWLIVDSDTLLAELRSLDAKLKQKLAGVPLIALRGNAVRMNVADSSNVCFSGRWMSLEAEDVRRGKSYRLRIERREIRSRLGTAAPVSQEEQISEKLGTSIYGLLNNDPAAALENLDTMKRVQRAELRNLLAAVGLRLLVRQVDGVPELAVRSAK